MVVVLVMVVASVAGVDLSIMRVVGLLVVLVVW